MFEHALNSFVPKRIAAVVPGGLTEFTRALIFFHPLPTKRAGYNEAEYAAQTGTWRSIYRYCDQQGVQLAASKRKLVFIFPIFNLADTCGRFPADWKSLVDDIMVMLRKTHAPGLAKEPKPKLTYVITASFSADVKYMHTFLSKATDLGGFLREVYDYDGRFSSFGQLSEKLGIHGGAKVITYDQQQVNDSDVVKEQIAGKGIHLPESRSQDRPDGSTTFLDYPVDPLATPVKASLVVHGAIPRYIMLHSLDQSYSSTANIVKFWCALRVLRYEEVCWAAGEENPVQWDNLVPKECNMPFNSAKPCVRTFWTFLVARLQKKTHQKSHFPAVALAGMGRSDCEETK